MIDFPPENVARKVVSWGEGGLSGPESGGEGWLRTRGSILCLPKTKEQCSGRDVTILI